jgi:peptide/nickel transport system permease protein
MADNPTTAGTLPVPGPSSTLARVARYALVRGLSLLVVVIVGVYITVLITNKAIVLDIPADARAAGTSASPIYGWFAGIAEPSVYLRPRPPGAPQEHFWRDSVSLLARGLTLNLGYTRTRFVYGFSGAQINTVGQAVLETLPRTLMVFGSVNFLVFFTSIGMALVISRRFGGRLDRLMLGISPLSAIPAWMYGVGILVFSLYVFRIYLGGALDRWPDRFSWEYAAYAARIMLPAVLALFLSKFFQSVLAWRSFLQVFSGEDYMELAKAKGLSKGQIERRYLLRPVLPSLITAFAMLMIGIWQEAIIVELFFGVVGIGHLFYNAIRYNDVALIVGLTVTFAYLLAISVFILDIIYALVDPRIRVGGDERRGNVVRDRKGAGQGRPAAPAPAVTIQRPPFSARQALAGLGSVVRAAGRAARSALSVLWDLTRVPSALAGMVIIALLVGVAIWTVTNIPVATAVREWNAATSERLNNPAHAMPAWTNLFRRQALPSTIILGPDSPGVTKTVTPLTDDLTDVVIVIPFDYPYTGFPQDITLTIAPTYRTKTPYAAVAWHTPDGREINVGDFEFRSSQRIIFSQISRLNRRLEGRAPQVGLFADPGAAELQALPGRYELHIYGLLFEDEGDLNADMVIYGQVHGLAGTDHMRRDMTLALLWGAPVALAIGLLGAVGTTFVTMIIAAIGAWFGGRVDGLVQRLTEVNMILPVFPILLVVYTFHAKSIWAILGVAIVLGVFGASIKTYRAIFLQVKEAPYVEAARAYGAGPWRIIRRYLVPPIVPMLVPQLILLIPAYVYLEATLAYLNMSDPFLPTWGKLIKDGLTNGGIPDALHTVLLPTGILLLTGLAFLMVGYALEKVLNPRLKDV